MITKADKILGWRVVLSTQYSVLFERNLRMGRREGPAFHEERCRVLVFLLFTHLAVRMRLSNLIVSLKFPAGTNLRDGQIHSDTCGIMEWKGQQCDHVAVILRAVCVHLISTEF